MKTENVVKLYLSNLTKKHDESSNTNDRLFLMGKIEALRWVVEK